MVDAAGRPKKTEDQEDSAGQSHKALVACAAQIVAEGAAKKGKSMEEWDRAQALTETTELRKDYVDLKNMLTQLQKRADEHQKGKGQPCRAQYNQGQRQAARGRGAPRRGGRGGRSNLKDTRKTNYSGGRDEDEPQENDGRRRTTVSSCTVNIGKREFAGRARVLMLGEVQEKEPRDQNGSEEDKPTKTIEPEAPKVMTRSMTKAKEVART